MTERFSPSIEFWIGVLQVVFASQDAAYYVEKNVFDIPYSTVIYFMLLQQILFFPELSLSNLMFLI